MASPNELESTISKFKRREEQLKGKFKKLMDSLSSDEDDWVPFSIKNLIRALYCTFDGQLTKQSWNPCEVVVQFTFSDVEQGKELDFEPIINTPFAILRVNERFFNTLSLSEEERQDQLVWAATHTFDFISQAYSKQKTNEKALSNEYQLKDARESIVKE